jgi:hypothetical protein
MSRALTSHNLQGSPNRGGGISPSKQVKKVPVQYQRYLDKMSEALNKNMEKNIFPHWRNHQSMKGWCSMNYPSILTNPTIRRPTLKPRMPPSEQEPSNFTMW